MRTAAKTHNNTKIQNPDYFLYPNSDPDHFQYLMGSKLDHVSSSTVFFQNNAQVQINAWFKLTSGYQAHCLQFMTLFLYFKRTPGSI